ncbi:hypothetical protein YB2330_000472 [Saitoella coloradoensis]
MFTGSAKKPTSEILRLLKETDELTRRCSALRVDSKILLRNLTDYANQLKNVSRLPESISPAAQPAAGSKKATDHLTGGGTLARRMEGFLTVKIQECFDDLYTHMCELEEKYFGLEEVKDDFVALLQAYLDHDPSVTPIESGISLTPAYDLVETVYSQLGFEVRSRWDIWNRHVGNGDEVKWKRHIKWKEFAEEWRDLDTGGKESESDIEDLIKVGEEWSW